jgi:hypothetical protein
MDVAGDGYLFFQWVRIKIRGFGQTVKRDGVNKFLYFFFVIKKLIYSCLRIFEKRYFKAFLQGLCILVIGFSNGRPLVCYACNQ